MLQHAPDDTPIPHGLAGPRPLTGLREATADLPNGQTIAANPVKHLADQLGFGRDDLVPRLPPTRILRHIAVAIGRPAEHIHGTSMRGMPLATAVAFDDLGALILGDHPLDL